LKTSFPVAVFGYNRPKHLALTLKFLQKAIKGREIAVRCFIDGPKDRSEDIQKVEEVNKVAQGFNNSFTDFEIIKSRSNQGLANSILSGINSIFLKHDSVVVLEDDILISSHCIDYFDFFLNEYSDAMEVFSISAYNPAEAANLNDYKYDIFSTYRMQCWGWATWKDRWDLVDWQVRDFKDLIEDKKLLIRYKNEVGLDSLERLKQWKLNNLDVWATRFVLAHVLNDARCICPVLSHSANIGLDGSGTHCRRKQDTSFESSSKNFFEESNFEYNYFSRSSFRFPTNPKSLPSVSSWFFGKEPTN
tara:strand:- start:370 stop:1281 length:912 start_codon:yes stop_codon:yes gene_type:complete